MQAFSWIVMVYYSVYGYVHIDMITYTFQKNLN